MIDIDKYTPPPLPKADMTFHLPLYGGIVPPRPIIPIIREEIMPAKMPEPRHIKLHIMRRGILFGYLLDKTNGKLHIFLLVFDLEIPLKVKNE